MHSGTVTAASDGPGEGKHVSASPCPPWIEGRGRSSRYSLGLPRRTGWPAADGSWWSTITKTPYGAWPACSASRARSRHRLDRLQAARTGQRLRRRSSCSTSVSPAWTAIRSPSPTTWSDQDHRQTFSSSRSRDTARTTIASGRQAAGFNHHLRETGSTTTLCSP